MSTRFDIAKSRLRDQNGNQLPGASDWEFVGATAEYDPATNTNKITMPAGGGGISVDGGITINLSADGTLGVGPLAHADLDASVTVTMTSSVNRNVYGCAINANPLLVYPGKTFVNGNAIGGADIIIHHNSGSVSGGAQNRWQLPNQEGSSTTLKPGDSMYAPYNYGAVDRWVKEPYADALVNGLLVTDLATTRGRKSGEVRKTKGHASVNTGGAGDFEYEAGNTTPGRTGMVAVVPGHGRWTRIVKRRGWVEAEEIGVKGEPGAGPYTNQHNLMLEAIEECKSTARAVYHLKLPIGAVGVCPAANSAPLAIPGLMTIEGGGQACSALVVQTALTDGTGQKGVIEVNGAFTRLRNFSIQCMSPVDPRNAANNLVTLPLAYRRHGILINNTEGAGGQENRFEDLYINGMSGSGIRALTGFQAQFDRVYCGNTGLHNFWLVGDNTYVLIGCTTNAPAENYAGLRIDGGNATIIGLNGLHLTYTFPGIDYYNPFSNPGGYRLQNLMCVELDLCDATFHGSNFEDHTGAAIRSHNNRAPNLINCTQVTAYGDRVRFLHMDYCDTPGEIWGNTRLFGVSAGAGGWGTVGSGVTDVAPFQVDNGTFPFFFRNVNFGPCKHTLSGALLTAGSMSYAQQTATRMGLKHSHIVLSSAYWDGQFIDTNFNFVGGTNSIDCTTNKTGTIQDDTGGDFQVNIVKGSGVLTVQYVGGLARLQIAGENGLRTSITLQGKGKSLSFRRATLDDGAGNIVVGYIVTGDNSRLVTVTTTLGDVSDPASKAYVAAPCSGRIVSVQAVLHLAVTTADAAISTAIQPAAGGGFTAITNGGFTIDDATSADGKSYSATPTAANTVAMGDSLRVATDGGSTGTAPMTVTFVIERTAT